MKTVRSRLVLISLLLAIPLSRSEAAWNSVQWGEGARPVSETTVACWLMDPHDKLIFLVLLRGTPGWYGRKTTTTATLAMPVTSGHGASGQLHTPSTIEQESKRFVCSVRVFR